MEYNSYETKFTAVVEEDGQRKNVYLGKLVTSYQHTEFEVLQVRRVLRQYNGKLRPIGNFKFNKKYRLDRKFSGIMSGVVAVPYVRKF